MSIPLQRSVVYGPIFSRRLGRSLGINLFPGSKFCLSNCIYCQYGWTDLQAMKRVRLRPAGELAEEMERDFSRYRQQGFMPDSITFSGNGEPTLYPAFGMMVREAKRLRDRFFPKVPVTALSDSSRVHRAEVGEALAELDECFMKLDAGDFETYCRINNPLVARDWNQMIQGLRRLPSVTIQSLFISAPVDNSEGTAFQTWLELVSSIHPKGVHVYTVDRRPADPRVVAVSPERLSQIANLVRKSASNNVRYFDASKREWND